jgi:hypothetical protein
MAALLRNGLENELQKRSVSAGNTGTAGSGHCPVTVYRLGKQAKLLLLDIQVVCQFSDSLPFHGVVAKGISHGEYPVKYADTVVSFSLWYADG